MTEMTQSCTKKCLTAYKGDRWRLTGDGIFIGKEGVVAPIVLTSEQLKWYEMTDTAAPHISMALHPGHEAREKRYDTAPLQYAITLSIPSHESDDDDEETDV